MSDPHIVAIETSGRHGSVAVARGATLLAVRELSPATRHAAELMPAVRELVAAQGWRADQIEELYLSLGPGSFTGLRIAVAMARALHLATGCRLVGVPSLDVIAENAPAEFAIVIPILDAKRHQVFAARYEREAGGALRQTIAAGLVDPAAFVAQVLADASARPPIAGEAKPQIALLGEGLAHYQPLPQPELALLPAGLWAGHAAMVHRLGYALARQGRYADPAALLPIYIRLPEAEEVYRRKHNLPV